MRQLVRPAQPNYTDHLFGWIVLYLVACCLFSTSRPRLLFRQHFAKQPPYVLCSVVLCAYLSSLRIVHAIVGTVGPL